MIQVAPTLTPPVDYSVRFGNDIQDFPESSCDAFICRHVFNSSLPTADEFQLVVIVSNGLGNGQSVTFPTSGEHVIPGFYLESFFFGGGGVDCGHYRNLDFGVLPQEL